MRLNLFQKKTMRLKICRPTKTVLSSIICTPPTRLQSTGDHCCKQSQPRPLMATVELLTKMDVWHLNGCQLTRFPRVCQNSFSALVKKQGASAAIVRATSKTRPVVGPVLVLQIVSNRPSVPENELDCETSDDNTEMCSSDSDQWMVSLVTFPVQNNGKDCSLI